MPKSVLFGIVLMAGLTCAAVFVGLMVGHASDEEKLLLYLRFAVVGLLVAGVGLWQVLAARRRKAGSGDRVA